MKLIADSGATKTHWVLLNDNKVEQSYYSAGFNPYYYGKEDFKKSVQEVFRENLESGRVKEVHFYGSGVSSTENKDIVRNILAPVLPRASIFVYHDLHGAAVALLGRKKGIACILGTGSNSCSWDGAKIIANVPSLGYMLGDEGSGTYMGKLLVRDILLGEADEEVASHFYEHVKMDFNHVLDRIYKEDYPNRFFAEQARFLRKKQDNSYCRSIVTRSFEDFIRVQVSKYEGYQRLPVSFTGSIAANFKDTLSKVLDDHGIRMGTILKEPMEGLIRFHAGN